MRLGPLALVGGLLAIVSAPGELNKLATDLSFIEPGLRRIVVGTVHVTILSLLLFALKDKALIIYALLEALLAFAVCGWTIDRMPDQNTPFALLGLVTSVYFLVRSLDNLKSGWAKREKRIAQARQALINASHQSAAEPAPE